MNFKREYKNSKVTIKLRKYAEAIGDNKYIIQMANANTDGYVYIEYFESQNRYEEELKEMQESKAKPDITKDNNLDIIDVEKMIDFVEERMENIMIRNDDKFIRNAIMAVLEAREDYIKSELKGGIQNETKYNTKKK